MKVETKVKKTVKLSLRDDEKAVEPVMPELKLFLKQCTNCIVLCGVANDGLVWRLLSLRQDGKFVRSSSIADNLGLQLNENREILEA
jgi:hypothetical protein